LNLPNDQIDGFTFIEENLARIGLGFDLALRDFSGELSALIS
jgi:hypothetical protein